MVGRILNLAPTYVFASEGSYSTYFVLLGIVSLSIVPFFSLVQKRQVDHFQLQRLIIQLLYSRCLQVMSMEALEAASNALDCVLEAKKGESIAIFCDDEKMDIGQAFTNGALKLGLKTRLVPLQTEKSTFRQNVPSNLTQIISNQPPDIYINLLRGIREEVVFRIQLIKMETEGHRSRLGHCPGVTMDMLTEGALALTADEHKKMQGFANELMKTLSRVEKIMITNPTGTDVSLAVGGRLFFTDTLVDRKTNKWMNLPTGEVIVAPIEDGMEGQLVCDMAVGGIGPIKDLVKFTVKSGVVSEVVSKDKNVLSRIKDSLQTDERSSTVGEFAFGINPKARFIQEFLEAEKLLGTIHIAFGNNSDFPGGKNPSKNHLDLLVSKPTVRVLNKDGSAAAVLVDGKFQH